jgi:hypothetical protein
VTGPVLLLMADAQETLVLVIGSGVWRWADLQTPPGPHPLPSVRR